MSRTFLLGCAFAAQIQQVQSRAFDLVLLVVCVLQNGLTPLSIAPARNLNILSSSLSLTLISNQSESPLNSTSFVSLKTFSFFYFLCHHHNQTTICLTREILIIFKLTFLSLKVSHCIGQLL